jgi:5-methylcytosine-specific restriction endonuclease McrA
MEEQLPTTQSLSESEKDKVISVLIREIESLKKDVTDIKNKQILETLQLPEDDLKAMGVIKPPAPRLRKGRGNRPLMESEIKEAYEACDTATGAARHLGVSYNAFQRAAKRYGMWKTNPWGRGSRKRYWSPDKGKYPLNQILEGKFPDYPIYRLKDLLIRSGTKEAKCENCGFSEHRLTDHKMPLILNFEDGNERNHKLENLKIFCYNCTFLCGKGYTRRGRVEFNFLDPDRIQGASKKIEARW